MAWLGKDLTYSLRSLIKQPGFTLIAVLTLAVGIGANTTIFSVVKSVLLQPLPYANSDRLVWIWESSVKDNIPFEPASVPNFHDWKEQNQVFTEMAAFVSFNPVLTARGEQAERLRAGVVSANLFTLLGWEPVLGRTFNADEGVSGGERVVIVSHGLWQRRLGGTSGIVGSTITLNGDPATVIGVMPVDYRHLDMDGAPASQLWFPMQFDPATQHRRSDFLRVVALLKPGVDLEQARAGMETVASRLEQEYPATNTGWSVTLTSLENRFSGDVRTSLLVLFSAVAFLLLIACTNVANLQLTRATSRRRETAIRTALGAGRWQLIRHFLVESTVLAVVGGVAGVALSVWGVDLLLALRPAELPLLNDVEIDSTVLAFSLALSLATGLLFGLVPALIASRTDIRSAMQEGGRDGGDSGVGGRRVRGVLVVAEVAIALLMLIGAGLMVRSLFHMINIDPGVSTEGLLTAELNLPRSSYGEAHLVQGFYRELLQEIGAIPGVQSVAATTDLPLTGAGNFLAFDIEGRTLDPTEPVPDAIATQITPDYFSTMGISLLDGRLLAETDREDSPTVVVVNHTLARRHWPTEPAVGRRISFGGPDSDRWIEIVGVVSDVHDEALDSDPYAQLYAPHAQFNSRGMALTLRTAGDSLAVVPGVRRAVSEIDPDIPVTNIRTMETIVADSLAQKRFSMILLSVFAGLALLLAAVGIYGVISYSVSQRTREFGVRMALGAQRADVRRMVVSGGLALAGIGIAIGLVASFGLTRLMSSLVFGVSSSDPVTFAAIAVLLSAVAIVACYIPARRATRVDPMVALRYE